ncbi:MAG: hypothetical protein LBG13_03600 [Holosporales bacterium]|nr:hypothetical protein [Holosporales bacterium]
MAVLLFLYMFCTILCIFVGDTTDLVIPPFPFSLFFIDDYWLCVSYMFGAAVFVVLGTFFLKNSKIRQNTKYGFPLIALASFSVINVSDALYDYFLNVSGIAHDYPQMHKTGNLIVVLVNALGFVLYLAWCQLERIKEVDWRRFCSAAFGALFLFMVSGVYLANKNVPISLFRTINYNSEIKKAVNNLSLMKYFSSVLDNVEAIKASEEAQDRLCEKTISFLESGKIKYNKVDEKTFSLSWEYEPLVDIVKNKKVLRRLSRKIDDFKNTKNTREYKLR